jgi:NAD(P)H-hydrate epimerase
VSRWQRHVFQGTDGEEVDARALRNAPYDDVVVDALIGYGLKAAPTGTTAELIVWANASGKPVIALDVPSGIDATTGEAPGDAIVATETLTLALPKTGLVGERPGQLFLADIGIPIGVYRRAGILGSGVFDGRHIVPLTAAR